MPRRRHVLALLAALAPWSPVTALAQPPSPSLERIGLTPEERAWIAAHPVVLTGHDPTYAPYAFPGPDGQLMGIDIDYFRLIAGMTGLRFEHREFPDWRKGMEEFKAGRIDVVASIGHTSEREAYTIYTRPYTLVPNVIVTRTDTPYLLDLRELKGQRVGVARGYSGLIGILKDRAPGCTVVEYEGMNEALNAVARGGIDAIIADVVNASYSIKALHLTNLRLGSVISGAEANFIGVRKGLPILAGIIDKAVAAITPLERKEIDERWIGLDVLPSRWVRAFKVAAVVAALALGVFLLAFFHNRRLARELAERRRIQLALEEAHARLARVSTEKSELLHMVAHDLRSPLTSFQLGTELLEAEHPRLSVPGREAVAALTSAVGQMRHMVDGLVDAHRLEEGPRDNPWLELDLRGLLREAVTAMEQAAARKDIHLALHAGESAAPVRTDARALRHVMDNLISNAIKYSPAGTEVQVELGRAGSNYRVRVCDQGPGVKPEEREKIFEKYARGSAMPTGDEKSTGLGLWIVRRLITALRGRVWCESGPGQVGAAFVVEVPLATAAA